MYRLLVLVLAGVTTGAGCHSDHLTERAPLETAMARPIVFVRSFSLIAECVFPSSLESLNTAGSTGRLKVFSFSGFFAPDTGSLVTEEIAIAFPSTLGADDLSEFAGINWSARLLSPRQWPGDNNCPAAIVNDGPLEDLKSLVIPFKQHDYCVISYDNVVHHSESQVCIGRQVGPEGDWETALAAFGEGEGEGEGEQ